MTEPLFNWDPMLQFFAWEHLPVHLQAVSQPFGTLAELICTLLPDNRERRFALRKLLEAKDCAVRAAFCGPDTKASVGLVCKVDVSDGLAEMRALLAEIRALKGPDA